ncbi:MAG: SGNH/GDSL hydrolase family protein [Polyangiales bacterium]
MSPPSNDPPSAPPRSLADRLRARPGALRAGIALGAVLTPLLVAEGVARALFPETPELRAEVEFVGRSLNYLQPCFRRVGGALIETNAGLPGTSRARWIRRARTPGLARVAVIGESSAEQLGESLGVLGARLPCGRRVEVLNCAIPGSGLEHLQRRFDEVMRESPDVVVVTFGHNLRFMLPTDSTRLWARRLRYPSRLLTRLGGLFDRAPRDGNAPLAGRLAQFESFLRRAAGETRARRVGLVVSTMPSNLWMPPSSMPAERSAPARLDARFVEATVGARAAAEALPPATGPGDPASLDFERGVLYARAGDLAAARDGLQRALERDSFAMRASARVNELIRRVAAQEGVVLRDTDEAIAAAAPQRLSGWESFQDNCHLLPARIDQEALEVLTLARPSLGLPASCVPARPARTRDDRDLSSLLRQLGGLPSEQAALWYDAVSLRVERRMPVDPSGATREVERYLRETPTPPPEALVALAEGFARAGRGAEARALNARARALRSADAWVQLALFELRARSVGPARAALQQALAIDPQRADARRFLARLAAASP